MFGVVTRRTVWKALQVANVFWLFGRSGAGKTTLFALVSGFLKPDSGNVLFDGNDITALQPHAIARLGMTRTFQIVQPFSGLSVLENIMLGAFMHTTHRAQAEAIARDVAHVTDLTSLLDTEARSLTVGGMKRLEVARALATRPRTTHRGVGHLWLAAGD